MFAAFPSTGSRRRSAALAISLVPFVLMSVVSQVPPQPENIDIRCTSFLDHETPIANFSGKTFLRENIPYIDIPDKSIQDTYYYRWSSLARHLRYSIAGAGYVLTEFVQPVSYENTFSTIDAAAGHQIDEARWLRSKFYTDDYARFWTRGPGNTLAFTHWILDAIHHKSEVDGNTAFLTSQLQGMLRLWHLWDFTFDPAYGLYYYTTIADAQELSLPGYVVSNGGLNNITLLLVGPDTYRPSHNSYMIANARAIARTAQLAGNTALAHEFMSIADKLEAAMFDHLWSQDLQFFVDVIRPGNSSLGRRGAVQGREEIGLFPFRFGIGLSPKYTIPSLRQLFEPEGFSAKYGPTTLERRNDFHDGSKPTSYCCYWNGQSWPFSTAHALKSLAAIYRADNSSTTAEQYFKTVSVYSTTQRDSFGNPFVAEAHYPEIDAWSAYTTNHSEHYDHSTYNDDVITGLLGLVPRSDNKLQVSPIIPEKWAYFALENVGYHGHLITVLYDANGTRYDKDAGLSIFVDGNKIHNSASTSALIDLPTTTVASNSSITPVNIAVNPVGSGQWPNASATYTYALDSVWKAIDGLLFYDYIPDNRWTNNQSYHLNDTFGITFARPRTFSSVTLAIYSDRETGGSVDCPSAIEIHSAEGLLANVSNFGESCLPNDRNTISFGRQVTSLSVSVNMYIKRGYAVGLAEFEVWVPPNRGPVYYMVDAYLTNALVRHDPRSSATTNGAVVGNNSVENSIMLSGVYSETGGSVNLEISYRNVGMQSSELGVEINRFPAGNLTLARTDHLYRTVELDTVLLPGENFVTLNGGNHAVTLETMTVTAKGPKKNLGTF